MTKQNNEIFGHPKGLIYLFFAELWERFSYYGMRALLTLYMVNEFFLYITDEAAREEMSIGIFWYTIFSLYYTCNWRYDCG